MDRTRTVSRDASEPDLDFGAAAEAEAPAGALERAPEEVARGEDIEDEYPPATHRHLVAQPARQRVLVRTPRTPDRIPIVE